jgi:hypothetical protein
MIAPIEAPLFAAKGSQRWLQIAVNREPTILDTPLRSAARLSSGVGLEWLSPLASENFVEYSDGLTFDRLGIKLEKRSLEDYWPLHGPRWDGLARATTGDVFLVEAKAHIGEMVSGGTRASEASRAKISQSLGEVQREIAPKSEEIDWTRTFYQYANRLAHLHLLRMQNDIHAHLVLVYFLNATDVDGSSQQAEYEGATKIIEHYLGIRQSKLSQSVHKLYVDVRDLPTDG